MDVEAWRMKSAGIGEKLFGLPEIRRAGSIMLYLAMSERREVDTGPLITRLCSKGDVKLLVPYTTKGDMYAAPYCEGDALVRGAFGQREPAVFFDDDPVHPDVMVIPAVAVDRKGSRLGYGRGYYDRFISGLRGKGELPFLIAPVFSFQLLDNLPNDPWDEMLHCVVTEKEILRFNQR